jgi:TolB-like protein
VLSLVLAAVFLATPPRVVAVLYFDNNSSVREYDVLQKGLADMLVTDLAGVEGLQVVEREKLQKLIEELSLQRSKFFDASTAQKVGKGIGAQYAVTGAIAAIDPKVRLDVRLIEVSTGRVIFADKVVGSRDRFFDLEDELVHQFVEGLSPGAAAPARSHVQNVDALVAYSKGVDLADRGDFAAASSQLAKVVSGSPDFQMAKERYADVLRRLYTAGQKRQALLDASKGTNLLQRRARRGRSRRSAHVA